MPFIPLRPHSTNANILYVGAVNGGIWSTTNATVSSPNWMALTYFEEAMSIGAFEFDPTDGTNQTLVAGIGRVSGVQTGLLRTTDGGAT